MKKIKTILCLLLIFSLAACSSDINTFEISGAEKLIVISGTTGNRVEITDTEKINYITDNINSLDYSNIKKAHSDGWSYSLQWIDKDGNEIEKLALLGDGHTVICEGYFYKGSAAIDDEIDLSYLDNLFSDNEEPGKGSYTITIGKTTEDVHSAKLKLSEEETAEVMTAIALSVDENGWVENSVTNSSVSCAVSISRFEGVTTYTYSANDGVFNDFDNIRSLELTADAKSIVNNIFSNYVSLETAKMEE